MFRKMKSFLAVQKAQQVKMNNSRKKSTPIRSLKCSIVLQRNDIDAKLMQPGVQDIISPANRCKMSFEEKVASGFQSVQSTHRAVAIFNVKLFCQKKLSGIQSVVDQKPKENLVLTLATYQQQQHEKSKQASNSRLQCMGGAVQLNT